MQETQSSSKERLTVEQLLQLKRLETPSPDFWEGFERDLKQKQLQTLMRPSRWERVRAAVSVPKLALVAPLAAAAIICVAVGMIAFSFHSTPGTGYDAMALADRAVVQAEAYRVVETLVEREAEPEVVAENAQSPQRSSNARFVEDVLKPSESPRIAQESFRTVAETKTFVGGSDSSAYYVVNAYTAAGNGERGARLEF